MIWCYCWLARKPRDSNGDVSMEQGTTDTCFADLPGKVKSKGNESMEQGKTDFFFGLLGAAGDVSMVVPFYMWP